MKDSIRKVNGLERTLKKPNPSSKGNLVVADQIVNVLHSEPRIRVLEADPAVCNDIHIRVSYTGSINCSIISHKMNNLSIYQ